MNEHGGKPTDVDQLAEITQRAIAKLDDVTRAKEAGVQTDITEIADEIEVALGQAHARLTDEESAEIWARCGAYLREHDPATYRLVFGIVVSLGALHEAPVVS